MVLSFSTCSQSFKKICKLEILGANVLKRALSLIRFSACTRNEKTNMPLASSVFAIFLVNCMQCVDGFSVLYQTCIRKGNNANPAILGFFHITEEPSILVPKGRAPFGQHQESRPLTRSNDIPVLNGFVNTID